MGVNPRGKRIDVFAMDVGGEVVVQDRMGNEVARLDATTAAVWEACSGHATPNEIATTLGLEMATAWAALDRLADAGLLVERVSPPGSIVDVSRRKLLARVGLGIGVAAVGGQVAMAQGGEQSYKMIEQLQKTIEQGNKGAEQTQKQGEQVSKEQHCKSSPELC